MTIPPRLGQGNTLPSRCSEHDTVPAAEKDAADECALRLGRTMSVPPDDMKLGVRRSVFARGARIHRDMTQGDQPWLCRVRCRRWPGGRGGVRGTDDLPEHRAPRLSSAGTKPTEPDHDDNDHRPDTQLAGPRHAAPLHEKAATSQYSQNAAHPMARTSSTTRIMTQTATVPGGTRGGAQVRDRKRRGREPSRDRRRRRAEVRAVVEAPLFLHESSSTAVWPRHMRWCRRWQLAIPIVWASGYERPMALP